MLASQDEVLSAVRDKGLLRSVEERRRQEEEEAQRRIAEFNNTKKMKEKTTRRRTTLKKSELVLTYPPHARDALVITRDDMTCLTPTHFLNDTLIDFYLRYLHTELIPAAHRSRFHFFNAFFYKTLTRGGYARVKNWTKQLDVFSFDFLLIPIITKYGLSFCCTMCL
jgi:Ulp1 family protease